MEKQESVDLLHLKSEKMSSTATLLSIVVYVDAFIWIVGVVPTLLYAFTYQALPTFGGIRLMGGLSRGWVSIP